MIPLTPAMHMTPLRDSQPGPIAMPGEQAAAPPDASVDGQTDAQAAVRAAELKAAASQFEGLLIHMMLKAMRSTVPESSLFADSSELKTYEELRDEELASVVAKRGGLGLAPVIERQLTYDLDTQRALDEALSGAREAGIRARVLDHSPVAGFTDTKRGKP